MRKLLILLIMFFVLCGCAGMKVKSADDYIPFWVASESVKVFLPVEIAGHESFFDE
jgi:hypothetical protein